MKRGQKTGTIRDNNPLKGDMLKALEAGDIVRLRTGKYQCTRVHDGTECLTCPYSDCIDTAVKVTAAEKENNARTFIDIVHKSSDVYEHIRG